MEKVNYVWIVVFLVLLAAWGINQRTIHKLRGMLPDADGMIVGAVGETLTFQSDRCSPVDWRNKRVPCVNPSHVHGIFIEIDADEPTEKEEVVEFEPFIAKVLANRPDGALLYQGDTVTVVGESDSGYSWFIENRYNPSSPWHILKKHITKEEKTQ